MPWSKSAKKQVVEGMQYGNALGGRISNPGEIVFIKPLKHGYEPSLELDSIDLKAVTKTVRPISRLSPFLC